MSHILRRRGTSSVGFSLSVAMTYRRFGGNVARLAEYRENRFHDAIFTRPNIIFQRRTVRHRHVQGSNTPNRRLQFVKAGLDDTCSDLRGHTTTLMRFIDDDDTAGFFYRCHQRRHIKRHQSPRVNDFHVDPIVHQLFSDLQAALYHIRGSDNRHVAAFAFYVSDTKRNGCIVFRNVALKVEQLNVIDENSRIVTRCRALQQTFHISRRRGKNDFQSRVIPQHGLWAGGVLRRATATKTMKEMEYDRHTSLAA